MLELFCRSVLVDLTVRFSGLLAVLCLLTVRAPPQEPSFHPTAFFLHPDFSLFMVVIDALSCEDWISQGDFCMKWCFWYSIYLVFEFSLRAPSRAPSGRLNCPDFLEEALCFSVLFILGFLPSPLDGDLSVYLCPQIHCQFLEETGQGFPCQMDERICGIKSSLQL